ncbi:hypothetical protein JMN32_17980 [Fulvivirga sp. 29W222]|uniref:CD-NTase-associated protein 12/Pycsar effector protein TIR domain-containing protein n=1 Tax=Fulvivirga marina TaxID=2494733 RepID=A0A937FXZ9_9BACT|nr:hypothetical protein [Fulvivirga marina]MBL6448209.1 hypothetical protein [Fulvivirga marina]
MKLKTFYSWQSDLPNNSNRGFINSCLEKALKEVYKNNEIISEFSIESDSRDDEGTPDLVSSIFSKIDSCDIFVADISIINKEVNTRKTPNPNVLIELGYACSKIGWEKTICVFNSDYGLIENLPFDIRNRKPITFHTKVDKQINKESFIKSLTNSIQGIIDNKLSNKKYYKSIKREVDLGIQAILFDILKILYFDHPENIKKYEYNRLLHITKEELISELEEKEFLGFQLYKNHNLNISDFKEFFNDDSNMHFFNEKEKNILAQFIMELKKLSKLFTSKEVFKNSEMTNKYIVVSGKKMNPNNPDNGYILLEKTKKNEGIVRDSGDFENISENEMLNLITIKTEYLNTVTQAILEVTSVANDWIRATGGVFIINERELKKKEHNKT